jgi:hypothetical protein
VWAAAIGTAAALAFVVFRAVKSTQYESELKTAQITLRRYLDDRLIEDADRYLHRLNPRVLEAPELGPLRAKFEQMKQDEDDRVLRFRKALDQARLAPTEDARRQALEAARSRARKPAERAEVDQVAKEQEQQANQSQQQRQERFRSDRETLRGRSRREYRSGLAAPGALAPGPPADLRAGACRPPAPGPFRVVRSGIPDALALLAVCQVLDALGQVGRRRTQPVVLSDFLPERV